jgi:lipopolysaccharide transport system permease protein
MIKPLWAYRGFIFGSVKREFQSKYRETMFGVAWNVVQPLATIIVYTAIFAGVMQAKFPGVESTLGYSIYLCAGIMTWKLFVEITTNSLGMFLDNGYLLKKLSFPRLCLPLIVVANALLDFVIVFGLFTAFLLISGNFPGLAYLGLLPILTLLLVFAVGLGVVLGVINVFFRDVGQFFKIFITLWFWLTPIVYPASILPPGIQSVVAWNPMAGILAAVQGILVKGEWPLWGSLVYPLFLGSVLSVLGFWLFRKRAGEMVDEL